MHLIADQQLDHFNIITDQLHIQEIASKYTQKDLIRILFSDKNESKNAYIKLSSKIELYFIANKVKFHDESVFPYDDALLIYDFFNAGGCPEMDLLADTIRRYILSVVVDEILATNDTRNAKKVLEKIKLDPERLKVFYGEKIPLTSTNQADHKTISAITKNLFISHGYKPSKEYENEFQSFVAQVDYSIFHSDAVNSKVTTAFKILCTEKIRSMNVPLLIKFVEGGGSVSEIRTRREEYFLELSAKGIFDDLSFEPFHTLNVDFYDLFFMLSQLQGKHLWLFECR